MKQIDQTLSLQAILDQFRDDAVGGEAGARDNRDLGDRFERLMQQFFGIGYFFGMARI